VHLPSCLVTDAELTARLRTSVVAYKQLQATHGLLRALALPGVWAFAQPARPELLQPQQAFFEDAGALEAALAPLEDFYRGQQVPRWRVQVPPGNAAAEQALARRGYQPQGSSGAMGLSLADTDLEPPSLPLERLQHQEELVPLNAEAFGPRVFLPLEPWHSHPQARMHLLGVREGGRLLSGGLAYDVEDTAGIYLVATAPRARGRGLATEVMRGLLMDARARGCAAAVLQSTELGFNVYRRVGFRDLGAWVDWVSRPG
jgi:GNAT superfamily N-acetyltransferase